MMKKSVKSYCGYMMDVYLTNVLRNSTEFLIHYKPERIICD